MQDCCKKEIKKFKQVLLERLSIKVISKIVRENTGIMYNVPDPVREKTDIDYTNITGLADAIHKKLIRGV